MHRLINYILAFCVILALILYVFRKAWAYSLPSVPDDLHFLYLIFFVSGYFIAGSGFGIFLSKVYSLAAKRKAENE
jgi:formate hydrogenlyase subunit 3/multisubunit Na+/H+ antiporter MnhD subunit